MLTAALLAVSLGSAAEPPPQPLVFQRDSHWEDVYGRADRTAKTGLQMSIAALPLMAAGAVGLAIGIFGDDPTLALAGAFGIAGGGTLYFVGPPLLIGGSMRARYALEQQGLYVSPQLGQAGWACYGGSFVVYPLWFGAVGFGAAQRGENRAALRALGYEVRLDVGIGVGPDFGGAQARVAW